MVGHLDHRLRGGQLRQAAGIDAVDFQKIERRLHTRPLVAVEVRLAFGDVIGVCRRYLAEVAFRVEIDVQRLGDCGFQRPFVPQTMNAAKPIDLIAVNLSICSRVRKTGSCSKVFSRATVDAGGDYLARRRNSPACAALVLRCAFSNCSFEAVRTPEVVPLTRVSWPSGLRSSGAGGVNSFVIVSFSTLPSSPVYSI